MWNIVQEQLEKISKVMLSQVYGEGVKDFGKVAGGSREFKGVSKYLEGFQEVSGIE